eukprot:9547495-Alexandrium_andersonii.AAC.1
MRSRATWAPSTTRSWTMHLLKDTSRTMMQTSSGELPSRMQHVKLVMPRLTSFYWAELALCSWSSAAGVYRVFGE